MTPTTVPPRFDGATREEYIAEIERLERFRADFLVLMAHEIRDPLWPLMNVADLFDKNWDDPAIRAKIRSVMRDQLERLRKLADGLIDVARVTYGRVPLEIELLDFGRLVSASPKSYGGHCRTAGIELSVEVPQTPVWVRGDARRLQQIVGHLIENACSFTDPGGRVSVRLDLDPNAKEVRLRVRDNGLGMGPDLVRNIFEPFCQPDRSRDRRSGGLGLGLALVKGLVSLHGGSIEAWSEGLGEGSEFTVRVPSAGEAPTVTTTPMHPPTAAAPCRVLIIEDNRDGTDMLRRVVEMAGHEVRLAYTGPEGVEQALAWHPEVILCDLGLPGLDGYAVAQELRRHSVSARLIAVTGYGTPEDKARTREFGFEAHLTKPADPLFLLSLIQRPGPQRSES